MFKINESLYYKIQSNVPGLLYTPEYLKVEDNNEDCHTVPSYLWDLIDGNSHCNLNALQSIIDKIKLDNIIEIGVARDKKSFTNILLKNKPKSGIYCGIDVMDKSFLNNPEENIYTIQCNSWDQNTIRNYLKSIGLIGCSLLLIDGWHAMGNTINDWMYSDLVDVGGVVVLHDTNYHPGPTLLVDAIDTSIYNVEKHCITDIDWGLAAAYKLKSY
jgi:hypothetical protein